MAEPESIHILCEFVQDHHIHKGGDIQVGTVSFIRILEITGDQCRFKIKQVILHIVSLDLVQLRKFGIKILVSDLFIASIRGHHRGLPVLRVGYGCDLIDAHHITSCQFITAYICGKEFGHIDPVLIPLDLFSQYIDPLVIVIDNHLHKPGTGCIIPHL